MIQKLKISILYLAAAFVLTVPAVLVASTAGVHAQVGQGQINNALCKGAKIDLRDVSANPGSQNCDEDSAFNLNDLVRRIINILSVIVGAIAVIMIIIGGFRYVTSAGNDSNVQAAKKTIMYALIGLVIVALAQIIVKFVLEGLR